MCINGALKLENQPCATGHAEPWAPSLRFLEKALPSPAARTSPASSALQHCPKITGTRAPPKVGNSWIHVPESTEAAQTPLA